MDWRTLELAWAVLVITTLDYNNPRYEGSPTFNSYGTLVVSFMYCYSIGKKIRVVRSPTGISSQLTGYSS